MPKINAKTNEYFVNITVLTDGGRSIKHSYYIFAFRSVNLLVASLAKYQLDSLGFFAISAAFMFYDYPPFPGVRSDFISVEMVYVVSVL